MSYATKQEAIIQEVLYRLQHGLPAASPSLLPPTGLQTPHRSPNRPLEEDNLPTFVVCVPENSEDDTQPEPSPVDSVYRRCAWLWIEARAIADSADPDGAPDKFLDPYVDYATSVMLTDEQLGGLCDRMEFARVTYASFDGAKVYVAAGMLFRIYYLGSPI